MSDTVIVKSLTATVHVKLNYDQPAEEQPGAMREVDMIDKILEQASDMDPAMRETLVKFAAYLIHYGQSP